MPSRTLLLWLLAIVAIYGLHRLALWLEARGQLHYLRKPDQARPRSGGGFLALQEIAEPRIEHVRSASDPSKLKGEEGAPGAPPHPIRFVAPPPRPDGFDEAEPGQRTTPSPGADSPR